jgi:Phage P22-like portal protein
MDGNLMADDWQTIWPEPPEPTEEEIAVVQEAKDFSKDAEEWEAEARIRFDYDYKFANGDTHNKYQWDADLVIRRELEEKPILTINKVQQHNLLIVNDAKQNKSGVRVRPVGDDASFEGAEMYQQLIYHIEYISNAENIYDNGLNWAVQAGIGYWYVDTDWIDPAKGFDQEIYIKHIRDPRTVYLDPNINEQDGSDARMGIIFQDIDKKLYQKQNPKFANVGGSNVLGSTVSMDGWLTKDKIREALYYRKEEKSETLVTFIDNKGEQQEGYLSQMTPEGKAFYKTVKNFPTTREREVLTENIVRYKIAGDRIISKSPWLGKYIPIVRLPGVETVIDGVLDRKGHTRALIDPQRMYNYNSSANIEFGALQTKAPWVAASESIEGYEEYYETANTKNHSYLPYNALDSDGNELPAPTRPQGPQPAMAYIEGMKISQNELMMASGQWQSQTGENENAKSGVAINARQRQGDKATYHFIDNQAMAIRFTGKILIDLIPKIYDTQRVIKIEARDGAKKHIQINPSVQVAHQQLPNLNQDKDISKQIEQYIFNPSFGTYDVQSDTGPSFATKRQEAFNALTQIAAQNPKFMDVGGDLYFKTADFPEADVLAERWRRTIPPNITGDAPNPQMEAAMNQAVQHIQMLQGAVAKLQKDLEDKTIEQTRKGMELDLQFRSKGAEAQRLDYEAETKRLTAAGNAGPGVSVEQIQPLLKELLAGMVRNGELIWNTKGPHEGGTPLEPTEGTPAPSKGQNGQSQNEAPPLPGAFKGGDGSWYINHPNGGYGKIEAANG